MHSDAGTPERPKFDSNTVAGGFAYAITGRFHANFDVAYTDYTRESFISGTTGQEIEYKKDMLLMALGVE